MEEFKDDKQQQEQEVELVTISKESNPDYDRDDDLEFQISPVAAAFIGLAGGFFLYQIVGALVTVLIFGMDLESVPVNESSIDDDGGTDFIHFASGTFICKMDLFGCRENYPHP